MSPLFRATPLLASLLLSPVAQAVEYQFRAPVAGLRASVVAAPVIPVAKSCLFNSEALASGAAYSGTTYLQSSVNYPASCESVTVSCSDGVLANSTASLTCSVRDPSYASVSLLMNFDSEVSDAKGHSLTNFGMTSVGSPSKWGNVGSFNGKSALITDNTVSAFGTGDFTMEAWVYPTAAPYSAGTYWLIGSSGVGSVVFGYQNASTWGLAVGGGSWKVTSTSLPPLNQWSHVAVTRHAASLRLFLNGALVGSTPSDYTNFGADPLFVGHPVTAYTPSGYMEDLRITKGLARYTTNFATPPKAFPAE